MNGAELCLRLPGRLEAAVFSEARLSEVCSCFVRDSIAEFWNVCARITAKIRTLVSIDKQSGAQYVKT